jgi:hypothetical protein
MVELARPRQVEVGGQHTAEWDCNLDKLFGSDAANPIGPAYLCPVTV